MRNKKISLFLALLFLVGAVFLERSERAWPLESAVISFLAKVTHHPLPSVTAVKMPLVESHLSPQDVALAFRAIVSFHPRQIMVLEPVGDFFTGPFSLVREAIERGELQGVPIRFLTSEVCPSQKSGLAPNIHLISLEDLLLRREERERGSIIPELDDLFVGETILLGGPQVADQAVAFVHHLEKKFFLPPGAEFILLLFLFFLIGRGTQLSWIDFLLLLGGMLICFVVIDVWLFQTHGKIGSLIGPCTVLILVFLKKFFLALRE